MCVPRRFAAFVWTTASQIRSVFTFPPNTSSRTSTAPIFLFSLLTTSSCINSPPPSEAQGRSLLRPPADQGRPLLFALLRFLRLRHLDTLGRNRLSHQHVAGRRTRNAALDD